MQKPIINYDLLRKEIGRAPADDDAGEDIDTIDSIAMKFLESKATEADRKREEKIEQAKWQKEDEAAKKKAEIDSRVEKQRTKLIAVFTVGGYPLDILEDLIDQMAVQLVMIEDLQKDVLYNGMFYDYVQGENIVQKTRPQVTQLKETTVTYNKLVQTTLKYKPKSKDGADDATKDLLQSFTAAFC